MFKNKVLPIFLFCSSMVHAQNAVDMMAMQKSQMTGIAQVVMQIENTKCSTGLSGERLQQIMSHDPLYMKIMAISGVEQNQSKLKSVWIYAAQNPNCDDLQRWSDAVGNYYKSIK